MGPAPGLGSTTFTVECWFRWNSGGSTASTGGGGVVGYPLVTKDGSLCTETDTCQAGVRLGGPATSCDDADACTTDACDPLLGCVHDPLPPPPEAALDLGFTGNADMEWGGSIEATHYAMYRGSFGGAPWSYGHTCLYPSLPSPSATDASTPPAAQGLYYPVSGRNDCGEGTLGTNSAGQTRPNASPCP